MKPLRGRVVIKEHKQSSSIIHVVGGDPREETTHRGLVLAVGPGGAYDHPRYGAEGPDQPFEPKPGDVVQFHFVGTEKGRTVDYPALGWVGVLVMAHREVDAIITGEEAERVRASLSKWPSSPAAS